MLNICLFGGGRWARVLAAKLINQLPAGSKLNWITLHCNKSVLKWLDNQKVADKVFVEVFADDVCLSNNIDAAIVATSPQTHHAVVKKCLQHSIPTLSEKPLTVHEDTALDLMRHSNINDAILGVNYEFAYASYLEEFKDRISVQHVRKVDVIWHDPIEELRHGELKRSEFSTSIIYDQFTHCWSIVRKLFPHITINDIDDVEYKGNSNVELISENEGVMFKFSLSRREQNRKRTVTINDFAIIDFTSEPGIIRIGDNVHKCSKSIASPLDDSLRAFILVAQNKIPISEWPSLVDNYEALINLCAKADDKLNQSYVDALNYLSNAGLNDPRNVQFRRLILDKYLPIAANIGVRVNVADRHEQDVFIKKCLSGVYDDLQ